MRISANDWTNYINKLSRLSSTASELMQDFVNKNGIGDTYALIDYAYALVTKYGEGSAELACQMYDAIAEMEKAAVASATPAEVANIHETAKAINGSLKQSPDGKLLNSVVGRLVKQAGADTTLQNALRDGAEFAWIPYGDTCSFCIMLAANGWQYASKKAIKGGHAEHIHANCNCQYAIRFNSRTRVDGYNPDEYERIYNDADGENWKEKLNSMRRMKYVSKK